MHKIVKYTVNPHESAIPDVFRRETEKRMDIVEMMLKVERMQKVENQAKQALFMIKYSESERDWMREKANMLQCKGNVKVEFDLQQYSDFINRRRCRGLIYYKPPLPFVGATDL